MRGALAPSRPRTAPRNGSYYDVFLLERVRVANVRTRNDKLAGFITLVDFVPNSRRPTKLFSILALDVVARLLGRIGRLCAYRVLRVRFFRVFIFMQLTPYE